MRGPRTPIAIILAVTMLAVTIPAAVTSTAAAQTADGQQVTRSIDAAGADTVAFQIETQGGETLEGSQLEVTAAFDDGRQRIVQVAGLVHGSEGDSCPGDGDDPCFIDQHAKTMEDVAASTDPEGNGDLRLDTGPGLDVAVEIGHDHDSFDGLRETIDLDNLPFTHAGSYALFVTVPGADKITAQLDLTVRDLEVTGSFASDAGFAHWLDDMRAAGTHTALGNAYTGYGILCGQGCGEVTVDVAAGERLYGSIGPGQNGFYNVHVDPTGNSCEDCFGPMPATFAGQWGAEWPGHFVRATGAGIVSGFSPDAAIATVPGAAGDTTFFLENYATLGPQDLVAAGSLIPSDLS